MFYDIFIKLCEERKVTPSSVVQKIGLNKSNVTFWKNGSAPKISTIEKLAEFFQVPITEFLDIKSSEPHPGLTAQELFLQKVASSFPNAPVTETEDKISIGIIQGNGRATKEEVENILRADARNKLDQLNYQGVSKAREYISDLIENPKYCKDSAEPEKEDNEK